MEFVGEITEIRDESIGDGRSIHQHGRVILSKTSLSCCEMKCQATDHTLR